MEIPGEPPFISTGQLPSPERVRELVDEAYQRHKENTQGECSQVYPALARADPRLFGACVAGINGSSHGVGDVDHPFTIMSVSKPFLFALICQALGPEAARRKLGVNGTGLPFNSAMAIDQSPDGRTNPMVNTGALATTSLVPGSSPEAQWRFIHEGLSRFAGTRLELDEEVYASALKTHHRNQGLAFLLHGLGRLETEPALTTQLYTRQCSLAVTARQLAVMGATLADGGVNPLTRTRVVDEEVCHHVLAVMATAGMYETSGDWLYDVGMPGKSGIGGGIVAVAPGKGALGTFAPRLDAAGNSIKGQLVARFLAPRLGLSLFSSKPNT
ncbi:glutaminase [Corallococcus praedator]|uniref:Glutaminase n=1 Tax=Corallococcus praedator TaxID=2316724 RepID=A0ABX9QKJ0_9BACT|nr:MULTISPECIES: glutaminase A [Corallococcus]RKH15255.1 glutaminase [Corallococcus sp. CA047B]RKH29733.1 glutaminase [Corallococcus sp. CA031C]RKI09034.1 glutaminase [Corallococcus praedator]